MSSSLANVRTINSFEESDEIMKTSHQKVVRLQAGFDAYQNELLGERDFRNLAQNCEFFFKKAAELPDVLFILVPGGTLCYWSFYANGRWEHVNFYEKDGQSEQVVFDEEALNGEAANHGITF